MFSKQIKQLFNKYTLLLLIIAFGAVLRSYDLFGKSLWYDEVFSVNVSDPNNSLSEVFHLTVEDVHPPFYQIMLWLVFHVFDYGERVGRVLSLVFGVALLPAIYCLGQKLFNERVGTIAALLSAVNFIFIAAARDTRSYSLLVFLAVMSFLFFLRLIEKKNAPTVVVYAVFASMLVNTHYFGFFMVMTQFVLLFYFSMRAGVDKRLLVSGGAAGLIIFFSLIPLFSYVLINLRRTDTWIQKPNEDFLIEVFVLLFGDLSVVLLCGMFMVFALAKLFVQADKSDSLKVLMLWWFLGFTMAWLRSLFYTPILSPRNMIVFVPVIIVLVSFGFNLVRENFVRWLLLGFVCVMSVSSYLASPEYSKLRIEHDLRSPVKKIIEDARNIPVYGDSVYSDYLKILGSPVRAAPYEKLVAEIKEHNTPHCFYILDIDRLRDYSDQLDVMVVEKVEYQKSSIALLKSNGTQGCEPGALTYK